MTASRDLDLALLRLAADGARPRCGEYGVRNLWLSEKPRDRAIAAGRCKGCPVFAECGAAAEERRESFGVWAGQDRASGRQAP